MKRDGSGPELSATMKRIQTNAQHFRLERLAHSISKSRPTGFILKQCFCEMAVSKDVKRSSGLPSALPDDYPEYGNSFSGALRWSALIKTEHQASLFFMLDKIKFLLERARFGGAYQYS